MALPLAAVRVAVLPDMTRFPAAVRTGVAGANLGREGQKAGLAYSGGIKKATTGLRSVFAGVGVLAFATGMGAAVKAAGELQLSTEHLRTAVEHTGTSWEKFGPQVAQAQKRMEGYGFTNDEVNTTLTALIKQTGSTAEGLKLLSVAGNLAAAKNIDLSSALALVRTGVTGSQRSLRQFNITVATGADTAAAMTKAQKTLTDQVHQAGGMADYAKAKNLTLAQAQDLVTKAMHGSIPALNRLGIEVLPQTANSAYRAAQFIGVMNARLGGAAAQRAKTFTGQMLVLKAELTDVGAKIGLTVLPPLTALLRAFSNTGAEGKILRGVLIGTAGALIAWKTAKTVIGIVRDLAGWFRGLSAAIRGVAVASEAGAGASAVSGFTKQITGMGTVAAGSAGSATALAGGITATGLATAGAVTGVAALAAGLGIYIYSTRHSLTLTQQITREFDKQRDALGFNTAGYSRLAKQIAVTSRAQSGQVAAAGRFDSAVQGNIDRQQAFSRAQQATSTAGQNLARHLNALQGAYGLTRTGAIDLAAASGVSAKALSGSGSAADKAMKHITGYADANRGAGPPTSAMARDVAQAKTAAGDYAVNADKAGKATRRFGDRQREVHAPTGVLLRDLQIYNNRTLSAKDRTLGLTDALKRLIGPVQTNDQNITTLYNDVATLAGNLKQSAGRTGQLTQKQRDSRSAFQQVITDTTTLLEQTGLSSRQIERNRTRVQNLLPQLERWAGHDKTLRGEVDALRTALHNLPNQKITKITVHAKGQWSVVGVGKFAGKVTGFAAGTTGAKPGWAWVGEKGPELAYFRGGETVLPTHESVAVAGPPPNVTRGYAAGVTGHASGDPKHIGGWAKEKYDQTTLLLIRETAKAAAAAIRALQGSGQAIADYARKFATGNNHPYVWGGTSPSGWDCSGFTGYVYRHFGYQTPRSSEDQYRWVKRTKDQPGALVFFNSPAGGPPPGHVGISMGTGRMANAAGTGIGTVMSTIGTNMGFGIPPQGFARGGGFGHGRGGTYGENQLGQLWKAAGGNRAHLASAIAMAESGGRADAQGPYVPGLGRAKGLWQILGLPFAGDPFDPMTNARMGVYKYHAANGFSPWEAYTNGAYRRFMHNGGILAEPIRGVGQQTGTGYEFQAGERVTSRRETGRGSGPLVTFGDVYVQDRADAELTGQRAAFAVQAAGFGR